MVNKVYGKVKANAKISKNKLELVNMLEIEGLLLTLQFDFYKWLLVTGKIDDITLLGYLSLLLFATWPTTTIHGKWWYPSFHVIGSRKIGVTISLFSCYEWW